MSCDQARWLHGYFDGELDAARATEFEAHLEACAACTQALATQQALRAALRGSDLYAGAPPALHARVREELRPQRPAARRSAAWWRGLAAAAAVLVVTLGMWRALPALRDDGAEKAVAAQVLDAHLRSLQLAHLTDVASTDQHTVKPWFVGKLDFAPPVVDLQADGFPLLGGRLDVVGARSVAALVYGRRKHVVNVFVWPAGGTDEAPHRGSDRGYQWVRWTQGGMRYWAVSDVAPADLDELVRRLRAS